jgi:hypothetical protein
MRAAANPKGEKTRRRVRAMTRTRKSTASTRSEMVKRNMKTKLVKAGINSVWEATAIPPIPVLARKILVKASLPLVPGRIILRK